MKIRVISSVVLIAIIALACQNYWASGVVVTSLIVLGLQEYFAMVERKGIKIYKYFGTAVGAAIPLSILFRFELTRNWELLFLVFAIVALIILQLSRRQTLGSVVDISVTVFGIVYVAWFFSFLIKIMMLPNGKNLLMTVLIVTKAGDIGAYLVGSRFGKTPLFPRVSPHKTWEGVVGGLALSSAAALLCNRWLGFSVLHAILFGAILGVVGLLGDLSESLLKRDCQMKDSGNFIPAMGGTLDMIDSILFTAPVFYLYMIIKGV